MTVFGPRACIGGEPVVVRTNVHPAWSADINGQAVPLSSHEGQLSFAAPCTGDCRVALHVPAHRALIPLAGITSIGAVLALGVFDRRRQRKDSGRPPQPFLPLFLLDATAAIQ